MTSTAEARRARQRLALGIACVALTFLVFRQAPGLATTDTKLDLVVNPWDFLRRGSVFWNPLVDAGVVQNQAYGYLFPMGPAFGAMFSLGIPAWVAQRLWESLLVCAAFLATTKLAREFGVRGFIPQIAAGLTYALAPRMVSELTTISSELMPMVVLPLMMIPLVQASRSGSARAGALLSGGAFALAGGINAAASLAILVAPALWLITRQRSTRRGVLMRWWALAIALASAWWIGPLLLLGRYSPPFLDWIESASITTSPLSTYNIMRGSTHWVSYLGRDTWPGGWAYAALPAVIVATSLVTALALWGLCARSARHRRYLLLLAVVGTLVLSFGHVSNYGPAWASWTQSLLDGPLAPFRNIHKFDPLVRLPLAIGLGYGVARLYRLVARERTIGEVAARRWRQVTTFALVCLVMIFAAPVLTGSSAVAARENAVASWWTEAGTWLDRNSGGARALVVPGSPAPTFLWGKTVDEPLQSTTDAPWTVRGAVPLTNAGYIRYLDQIEAELATGAPSTHLAQLLRDGGIGFIVLRNDLNTYSSLATPTEAVRATVSQSTGLSLQTSFGPDNAFAPDSNNVVNGGMTTPRPAIEIWRVDQAPQLVSLVPTAKVFTANGSSDNLTGPLRDQLGPHAAVTFDASGIGDSGDGQSVMTDGIRKRQAFFGASTGKSKTLTQLAPYLGTRSTYDYLPPGAQLSAYEYRGLKDVYATSSGDSIYAQANAGALNGPWSAIDGNPLTAWYSASPFGAIGESLRIDFAGTWSGSNPTIRFPPDMLAYPTALDVTTTSGTQRVAVTPNDEPQTLAIEIKPTEFLAVQAVALDRADASGTNFAISDLLLPGLVPQRYLVIPGKSAATQFHFERSPGSRDACRTVDQRTYCDLSAKQFSEEQYAFAREFTLTQAVDLTAKLMVSLGGGDQLDTLLSDAAAAAVTTSSTISSDPRVQGTGVFDDDSSTAWVSKPGDQSPWLNVTYPEPITTDGVTIKVDKRDPIAAATVVRVSAGTVSWTGELPKDGRVDFGEQVTATEVKVEILDAKLRNSTSTFDLRTTLLPAGISNLTVSGAPAPSAPADPVTIACGYGPTLLVNGAPYDTEVVASRADILAGRQVPATVCGDAAISLVAGVNRVAVAGPPYASPTSLDLVPAGQETQPDAATSSGSAKVSHWAATKRMIEVAANTDSVLVIKENANDGWRATLNGARLTPITIGGWQQGYLVPAGSSGTVTVEFAPAQAVRAALAGGSVLLLVLGGLCVLPHRPRTVLPAAREALSGSVAGVTMQVLLVFAGYQLAGVAGFLAGAALVAGWLGLRARLRTARVALAPLLLLVVAAGWVVVGDRSGILLRDRELMPSLLVYGALTISCLSAFVGWRRPDK